MIIAAHQPNCLPWLGFFDKLRRCDVFVVMDHVQFERANYQNRTRLFLGGKVGWLTIPVVQKSRDETILEKQVFNDPCSRITWNQRVCATLDHAYGKAPHYAVYGPRVKEIILRPWDRLVDFNMALMRFCMETLEIRTKLVFSSELSVEGKKSELILNMCKAVGGRAYLAGAGGSRHYLDGDAFSGAGVEILWQDFKHPQYPQVHSPHEPVAGLSVLDLLFNCGPASARVLASGAPQAPARRELEAEVAASVN